MFFTFIFMCVPGSFSSLSALDRIYPILILIAVWCFLVFTFSASLRASLSVAFVAVFDLITVLQIPFGVLAVYFICCCVYASYNFITLIISGAREFHDLFCLRVQCYKNVFYCFIFIVFILIFIYLTIFYEFNFNQDFT